MVQVILVFLGGGIGAAARHGVNIMAARTIGISYPWGTFIVNVVGCFAMGALAAWFAFKAGPFWNQHLRLFLTTGILGGFTTFSALAADTFNLVRASQPILAVVNSGGQLIVGLTALWAGYLLGSFNL